MTSQKQQAQQLRCAAHILETNSPWEFQLSTGEWKTSDQHILRIVASGLTIRVKETPNLIPLEASDIPPGSVFATKEVPQDWYAPITIGRPGVYFYDARCFTKHFTELKKDWLINRSIPLLGKWDPTAWEPCSKPSTN